MIRDCRLAEGIALASTIPKFPSMQDDMLSSTAAPEVIDDLRFDPPLAVTGNGWVLLFDPGVAHGFVKVIALLYLTSPRMLGLALMLHHKANRLKQMDVPACARVIGMLMRAQGRVPIEKIADEFPETDLSQIVPPLADVDGVVFLEKDEKSFVRIRLKQLLSLWRYHNPNRQFHVLQ